MKFSSLFFILLIAGNIFVSCKNLTRQEECQTEESLRQTISEIREAARQAGHDQGRMEAKALGFEDADKECDRKLHERAEQASRQQ